MEGNLPQRIPLETTDNHPVPPPAPPAPAGSENPPPPEQLLDADGIETIRQNVIAVLETCYDPEIPVNIY
ncbi:MAG TPA: hypothetical protein VNK04_02485, partial [Gemmataceae bacterium]|nr:hypothetical protein [Gemmataceae bacterium]